MYEEIATKIVNLQRDLRNLEKPVFPEKQKSFKETESLVEFVKPSSWLFFQAIQCNGDFFRKPAE